MHWLHSGCWFMIFGTAVLATEVDGWSKFPIPEYATEVQEDTFLENTARQLSFVVDRAYPFDDVRDFYVKALSGSWHICASDSTGWQFSGDGTRKPAVWIHGRQVHWVDYHRNRLVILGLMYESPGQTKPVPIEEPTNSRQLVRVVEYKHDDVGDAIRWLDIECEQGD